MEIQSIEVARQFNEDRFTKVNMIKRKTSVTFLLNFLPGQNMKPHNHPNRELYLHVIDGNGTLIIDEEELAVNQGDVIFCDMEEKIGFSNTSGANVSIYAVMTKISN